MSIVVSKIVEVSMIKIALWICVGVDDWTVEIAIIASNETLFEDISVQWQDGIHEKSNSSLNSKKFTILDI